MAQTVSELWTQLWQTPNTEREYAFDINDTWYGPEEEVEHDSESELYEEFGIGNATIGTLKLNLYADDIPRGACIKRYVRLKNGDQVSEWLPKGVFWANRRPEDDGYWTIEAFDAMRKAEVVWTPDQTLTFPMTMPDAVTELARIMGVEIDPRTVLNETYTIDYPANDATIRNELCWIAAAHGGNWIMTDAGKLLLVPLLSIPPETNYLVTESGSPITFGGMKILTSDSSTGAQGPSDAAKHFVGLAIASGTNNGRYKSISRVTLWLDDDVCLTAGDDTGFEVSADCPHATQAMVDTLLAAIVGYEYQAYEAEEANIDPAAELGDGVTVNGVYSVIARIADDGEGYPSLSAPGEAELEDEYPSVGPMTQAFNRQLAATRSLISKTATEITLQVEDLSKDMGQTLRVAADGVTITNADGDTLTIDGGQIDATTIKTADLQLTGRITWADLDTDAQGEINDAYSLASSASAEAGEAYDLATSASNTAEQTYSEFAQVKMTVGGQTYIDGSMIYTNTIYADALHLGGNLTVYSSAYGNTVGGYLGYTTSLLDGSSGIHMACGSGEVAATANGARLMYGSTSYQVYVGSDNCGIVSGGSYYFFRSGSLTNSDSPTLGTSSAPWGQIYSTNSAISTSDRRLKNSIQDIPEKYLDMLLGLTPRIFKLNSGTSDRFHPGFVAQEVKEAMDAANVSDLEFAGWIKDVDENGEEIYMLRYEEFIPLIVMALQGLYKEA